MDYGIGWNFVERNEEAINNNNSKKKKTEARNIAMATAFESYLRTGRELITLCTAGPQQFASNSMWCCLLNFDSHSNRDYGHFVDVSVSCSTLTERFYLFFNDCRTWFGAYTVMAYKQT